MWDSAVGTAAGEGLDDRRVAVQVPIRSRIFHFSIPPRPALGLTQPPIMGTGSSFVGG
jgi:hypothetical protein